MGRKRKKLGKFVINTARPISIGTPGIFLCPSGWLVV